MENNIQHIGIFREGKFIADHPDILKEEIRKLEGKQVAATFRKFRPYKQRSIEQNAYYWHIVVKILSDEFGPPPEEMHEILKYKFLSKNYDLKGKIFTGSESSANLSTTEMEEYLAKIRSWASMDFGIWIPEPNAPPLDFQQ